MTFVFVCPQCDKRFEVTRKVKTVEHFCPKQRGRRVEMKEER